ncbi:uncharacterized protein LOC130647235 [Hydractinia symbiolongicarpus]|uniref:uncharacterized protein LOC130647235 n=1 Tax=Hydractinia symbiolongicarpus TaxID=13093 RepID=UPI00254DCD56|nr:uncharacterized protein LOC130647235 [Hydractinia symbiolongicarpus]
MSSSDESESECSNVVLGFQFEPKRRGDLSDSSWVTYDSDSDGEIAELRINLDATSWCKCNNCRQMSTETECFCCHKLESSHIYNLQGVYFLAGYTKHYMLIIKLLKIYSLEINCIVNHEDFDPIVLERKSLDCFGWMYDRESTYLPLRNDVSNKTYCYASYRQFTW